MAVAATGLTTSFSDTDATSYNTASITPTGNRLVLAWVGNQVGSGTPNIPTLSGNGLTWVLVASTVTSLNRFSLYRAMGSSPSTGAITIDFNSQTQLECLWSVIEYSGVNTSGTNGSGAVANKALVANATDPVVTLTPFSDADDATAGGCYDFLFGVAIAAGSGFTETGGAESANGAIISQFLASNDTTVDFNTFGNSAAIAVAIREASSAIVPQVFDVGSVHASGAAISPGIPSGTVSGDLLIYLVETQAETSTVSGWTEAPDSPQTPSSNLTRLTVFYRYATTDDETDATTSNDAGNHQVGRIIGIINSVGTGSPFNVTAGGVDESSDNSAAIPGDTTTVANTLVIAATSDSRDDSSAAAFSGWANADLSTVTEVVDNLSTAGNGGGIGAAFGWKFSAGSYTDTTVTHSGSTTKGMWSGAILPPATATVLTTQDIALALTMDNTTITQNHVIAVQDIALALTEDNTTIVENFTVVPQDMALALTEDDTTLAQNHVIASQDIALSLTEDNTSIVLPLEVLSDDFDDDIIDTTKWNVFEAGGADVNETGSRLELVLPDPADATADADISSVHLYNLTGSYAFMRVEDIPDLATNANAELRIYLDSDNWFRIVFEAGDLYFQRRIGGSNTTIASVTYSSVTHLYWQIREDAGDIIWETSSDGSTWDEQATYTYAINITAMRVLIAATCYQAETAPGSFIIDDFNIAAAVTQILSDDIALGLSMDATTIAQNHVIAAQDIAFALTEDNGTVEETNFILSTQDMTLALTEDNATIAQDHIIVTADIALALAEDNTTLIENFTVIPDDVALALTEDATTINQNHVIASADIALALTMDNTAAFETYTIVGQDIALALTIDNATIAQNHVISTSDLQLSLTVDNATITQNHVITSADLLLSLSEDNTTIVESSAVLQVNDVTLNLSIDGVIIYRSEGPLVIPISIQQLPNIALLIAQKLSRITIVKQDNDLTIKQPPSNLTIQSPANPDLSVKRQVDDV